MYFRMLKRDLKDKIGLNITLFAFMTLASVFMVISSVMLYTKIVGVKQTYDKCKSSDIIFTVAQSISDEEGQLQCIEEWLKAVPEVDTIVHSTKIMTNGSRVDFNLTEEEKGEDLNTCHLLLSAMPQNCDIPLNLNDEYFTVSDGCVAIPQNLQSSSKVRVGDKIRVTTQMGNIYEFTVSDIFKNPSSLGIAELIFSDADYAVIDKESPLKYDVLNVMTKEFEGNYDDKVLDIATKCMNNFQEEGMSCFGAKTLFISNDGIISMVISLVMMMICIFMVAMIFITIHFSLKSAIKREEQEIGMMKAIGVYSFSYRSLFSVKYIAFAIAGGVLGLPIALMLTKLLINTFISHTVLPSGTFQVVLAFLSVCVCIMVIVGFTFLSLRRMNKISVMDTIHGEAHGERFRSVPGMLLHKKKHMNIPFFLALSDILSRVKRYIYLVLAYVAGISMILFALQMKDSIISEDYARTHWMKGSIDFNMDVQDAYFSQLYNKAGSEEGAYQLINDNFARNNIPAKAVYFRYTTVTLQKGDYEAACYMKLGAPDRSEIVYVNGGNPPKLYNEISTSYYNSKQAGIEIGDIVSITYKKYNEDNISSREVTEDFVVTAMYDGFGASMQEIVMGQEFDGAVADSCDFFKFEMDCDESEYDEYYKQMDDLYTDDEVKFMPKEDALPYYLGGFTTMFSLLIKVVSIIVVIVLTLLTVLYQSIFIEEETGDIAVLKSMGLYRTSIKRWQYFRMLILVLASIVIAHLFVATVGNFIITQIMTSILKVVVFHLNVNPFTNLIIIPASVLTLVTVILLPVFKAINSIQIWRIRNE